MKPARVVGRPEVTGHVAALDELGAHPRVRPADHRLQLRLGQAVGDGDPHQVNPVGAEWTGAGGDVVAQLSHERHHRLVAGTGVEGMEREVLPAQRSGGVRAHDAVTAQVRMPVGGERRDPLPRELDSLLGTSGHVPPFHAVFGRCGPAIF